MQSWEPISSHTTGALPLGQTCHWVSSFPSEDLGLCCHIHPPSQQRLGELLLRQSRVRPADMAVPQPSTYSGSPPFTRRSVIQGVYLVPTLGGTLSLCGRMWVAQSSCPQSAYSLVADIRISQITTIQSKIHCVRREVPGVSDFQRKKRTFIKHFL